MISPELSEQARALIVLAERGNVRAVVLLTAAELDDDHPLDVVRLYTQGAHQQPPLHQLLREVLAHEDPHGQTPPVVRPAPHP